MNNIYPFNSKIGFGTSGFGRIRGQEGADVNTLAMALDNGYTVFDTAEQYSGGKCETLLGKAIQRWNGNRSDIQIVSKIMPTNATSKANVIKHFKESLNRLQLDYIDVYLLHWYLPWIDIQGTVEAFLELKNQGLIRDIGLSNFNGPKVIQQWKDIELANGVTANSKEGCTVLQTRYSIVDRTIDKSLLKFVSEQYNLTIMAHSPFALGAALKREELISIANRIGITVSQLCLAWILRHNNTIAIPKTSTKERMLENLAAANINLDQSILDEIDLLFPPPPL